MSFIPLYDASRNTLAEGYWFLFREGRLVVREGEEISVPRKEAGQKSAALEDAASRVQKVIYAGSMDGISCYAADTAPDRDLPAGLAAMPLRSLYGKIPQASLQAARFIAHLLHWDRQTGFCGVCGGPLRNKEDERAKTCARCGTLFYPRISPAIIVAILDKEKILLAHNKRFASPVYSLIAGFIEMGETAEECIAREAEEEVGVQVKNIRY
ncbi:MAG: NUDIX domain-containing protein, partial [Spirochaetales bacterium]|nr:NUDIX domain-containing protein [Spirochaetales bacterium]